MTDETRAQAIAALAQWLELSKPKRIATDIEHAAHGLAVESLAALRALPAAPRPGQEYRCDDAYGCDWHGPELIPDPDGVLRCPACSSVAIIEPASTAAPRPAAPRPDALRSAVHAVHHQLTVGEASEGDIGDIEACARLLREALQAAPRPDAGEAPDDRNRCAVCGWPLDPDGKMCRVGSCSMRPLPERLYAPARAVAEYGTRAPLDWHRQAALTPSAPAAPGTPPDWQETP